jgi:cystathionine beta-lyase
MPYNFDEFPERRGCTESVKWNHCDPDVLPMWVADMDFVSPPAVIEALLERVRHGIFGYPGELPELCQVICERLDRLYAWKVQPEEVLFVPGVVTGFNQACYALASPGGGVLVQSPVYTPILKAAETTGALNQRMELTRQPDGTYHLNLEAFKSAITPETRMFLLCNPHNPVGKVFTNVELEQMAQACLSHGVTIVSDEIHCDLIYDGIQHIPIASLGKEIAEHTITLMAPSKTFNIAGLEFSFAIIQNPELRAKYEASKKGLVGFTNPLGMVAALAAYKDGQGWLDELLVYLEGNRDYLYDRLKVDMPQIEMAKPAGTYLAWLDCRKLDLDMLPGGLPGQFFLEKARVSTNEGKSFGPGGEGFIRLNFGCPRWMLTEALDRMQGALNHN